MWSPSLQGMHSHIVPFGFRSALRYGPFRFLECSPMWSLLLFRVHSHVVRKIVRSALPFGHHRFQKCTPKCSPPIYSMTYLGYPLANNPMWILNRPLGPPRSRPPFSTDSCQFSGGICSRICWAPGTSISLSRLNDPFTSVTFISCVGWM